MNLITIVTLAKKAVDAGAWWARFKAWQKERDAKKAGKVVGVLVLAYLTLGAAQCRKDIQDLQEYCRERPWECGGAQPTPVPTATPTPIPTVAPVCSAARPCDCWVCVDRVPGGSDPQLCAWHFVVCPAPTPVPTGVPTPTPTATVAPTPAPTPTPVCVPAPGRDPVSIRQVPRCRPGYVMIPQLNDPTLCAIDARAADGFDHHWTPWRIGDGMHRPGFSLVLLRNALVQREEGRGCVDADGRAFPGCGDLHDSDPYGHLGYPTPSYCAPPACAPVEAIEHWIVGGGGCHAWHPIGGGRVRCVLDSTIRPICDEDHQDNWNTFCGKRTHDPPYDRGAGAQAWTIVGAEDWGPNNCPDDPNVPSTDCNSAQRVIVGPAGGHVKVTICLRDNAVTYDGCPIPLRSNHCNTTEWTLPSSE